MQVQFELYAMTAIFSRSCEYAIQAVLFISNKEKGKPNRLDEIADALRIPRHYLSKILQNLAKHDIVRSRKGHNGGFELWRPAEKIKLLDIVRAIDGDIFLNRCVLGFSACSESQPCPAHSYWKEAKEIVQRMLDEKTIEDLSKSLNVKLAFYEPTPYQQQPIMNL